MPTGKNVTRKLGRTDHIWGRRVKNPMGEKGKNSKQSKEGGRKMSKRKNLTRKPGRTDHVRGRHVKNHMGEKGKSSRHSKEGG